MRVPAGPALSLPELEACLAHGNRDYNFPEDAPDASDDGESHDGGAGSGAGAGGFEDCGLVLLRPPSFFSLLTQMLTWMSTQILTQILIHVSRWTDRGRIMRRRKYGFGSSISETKNCRQQPLRTVGSIGPVRMSIVWFVVQVL